MVGPRTVYSEAPGAGRRRRAQDSKQILMKTLFILLIRTNERIINRLNNPGLLLLLVWGWPSVAGASVAPPRKIHQAPQRRPAFRNLTLES